MNLVDSVSKVRIYCDERAFRSDEFGRERYLEIEPRHDQLFQRALELKLASALVFRERRASRGRGTDPSLRESCSVVAERPSWWPANRVEKGRGDLLMLPLATLGWSWQEILGRAKPTEKQVSLWHDDPALVFSPSSGSYLCRTASTGHEGRVFYFAYPREAAWQNELERLGLSLFGSGESAYRLLVPVPGQLAGT
jgi:hypothetical protein